MSLSQSGTREKVFPYTLYHGRYYPIIPVVIGDGETVVVYALVDSGAILSLFHISIAEDAGISLRDAEQVYLAGIGGYIKAYVKKQVRISVEELGGLTIPAAFTEYMASDIAILGRQGFFEAFEIVFREWEKKLIIRQKALPA